MKDIEMQARSRVRTVVAILGSLCVASAAWAVFGPAIHGPFLIDDLPAIVLNRDVAAKTFLSDNDGEDLRNIWTKHDFWGQDLASPLRFVPEKDVCRC